MNESLINEFLPKIQYIASSLYYQLNNSELEKEDLVNIGIIGLLNAKRLFKKSKETSFSTFAEFHIKGSMLDSIRSLKFHSRGAGQKLRKISKAYQFLEKKFNRKVDDIEVSEYLNISIDEFYEDLNIVKVSNFDDLLPKFENENLNILETISNNDEINLNTYLIYKELYNSILNLQIIDQKIIFLYFYYGYSMKEIANFLQKTESRISQKIKNILIQLKDTGLIPIKKQKNYQRKNSKSKKIIQTNNDYYLEAKKIEIGSKIKCVSCGNEFIKKYKRHIFCSNNGPGNCKDKYWSQHRK